MPIMPYDTESESRNADFLWTSPFGLRVQAPFGARVLSFVCCAPNDGFGPQSGLVQRVVLYAAAWGSENRPTGLRSGGRQLAVRTAMEHPIGALPRTPFPASRDFPSRGNEKIGGTGYCVTYDTDSQSRNAPCVPFRGRGPQSGEGVDGAKNDYDTRCGRDRRRRHYKTHCPLKGKRLTTFCASLRSFKSFKMCSLCVASPRGPPIGGQDRDGASYRCSAPYTLSRFAGLPLKGKREI